MYVKCSIQLNLLSAFISLFVLCKSINHIFMVNNLFCKIIKIKLFPCFKIFHASVQHINLLTFIYFKFFIHFIMNKKFAHAKHIVCMMVIIGKPFYLQKVFHPILRIIVFIGIIYCQNDVTLTSVEFQNQTTLIQFVNINPFFSRHLPALPMRKHFQKSFFAFTFK